MIRLDLIAREWIGTPFRHQGRSRAGVDCAGLVAVCCLSVPALAPLAAHDRVGYATEPHDGLLEATLRAAFGLPVPDMRPGDIVACAFPSAVRHVAIVGQHPNAGLSLIHAYSAVGRVIEHRIDTRWQRRIRYVHRPEIA